MKADPQIEERIASLHAGRLIDLHYDLPLSLFLSRPRRNVVATDFLPEFETGDVGLLGVAVYVEDKHLGEEALRVVLDMATQATCAFLFSDDFRDDLHERFLLGTSIP